MEAEEERGLHGRRVCGCVRVLPALWRRWEPGGTRGTWVAAEQAQWRAQRAEGRLRLHCVERGGTLPRGHSPCAPSTGGFGLLGLFCTLLAALWLLHPVSRGGRRLVSRLLPLVRPAASQVSSVLGGRVKGRAKRQKAALSARRRWCGAAGGRPGGRVQPLIPACAGLWVPPAQRSARAAACWDL